MPSAPFIVSDNYEIFSVGSSSNSARSTTSNIISSNFSDNDNNFRAVRDPITGNFFYPPINQTDERNRQSVLYDSSRILNSNNANIFQSINQNIVSITDNSEISRRDQPPSYSSLPPPSYDQAVAYERTLQIQNN